MKRTGIYFWMTIKRMGKRPIYICLLLLFPIAIMTVPKLNKAAAGDQIVVGFVMEEGQEGTEQKRFLLKEIRTKLSEDKKNSFRYIVYEDSEGLKKDIITGGVSCGVVFREDFTEKLLEQDFYHCMALYLPEGMNIGGMVQEDLFQRVYQVYSAVWYADLLNQQGYSVSTEEVLEKFSEYQKQGKVFAVEYRQGTEAGKESGNMQSVPLLSLRGVLALLTLMSACLGALDGSRDREKGIGKGISHVWKLNAAITGMPILFAVIFLTGGMIITGKSMAEASGAEIFSKILPEAGAAFFYGLVLWLLAMLAGSIFSEKMLSGMIPCYLLTAVLCCPLFFELGTSVPVIGYLSKLFPVTWYLEFCKW